MLDYEEEKRIDYLIAAGDLTADERDELRALHARRRATEPRLKLVMPEMIGDETDLSDVVLIFAVAAEERPLGYVMNTDLKLAGPLTIATEAQAREYERSWKKPWS